MDETLHHLLMRFQVLRYKQMQRLAARLGLLAGQPKVLEFLLHHEGGEQKEIAGFYHIEPATVTSLLDRMEQRGLIERRQRDGNRRSYHVYLTEKGRQCAQQAYQLLLEQDECAFAGFDEAERRQFLSMLQRICRNLAEASAAEA